MTQDRWVETPVTTFKHVQAGIFQDALYRNCVLFWKSFLRIPFLQLDWHHSWILLSEINPFSMPRFHKLE